jgi:hypothetical protein
LVRAFSPSVSPQRIRVAAIECALERGLRATFTRDFSDAHAEHDAIEFDDRAALRASGCPLALCSEAHFNFIEMLEGGEEAQAYRDRYVQRIVDLIDEGRGGLD